MFGRSSREISFACARECRLRSCRGSSSHHLVFTGQRSDLFRGCLHVSAKLLEVKKDFRGGRIWLDTSWLSWILIGCDEINFSATDLIVDFSALCGCSLLAAICRMDWRLRGEPCRRLRVGLLNWKGLDRSVVLRAEMAWVLQSLNLLDGLGSYGSWCTWPTRCLIDQEVIVTCWNLVSFNVDRFIGGRSRVEQNSATHALSVMLINLGLLDSKSSCGTHSHRWAALVLLKCLKRVTTWVLQSRRFLSDTGSRRLLVMVIKGWLCGFFTVMVKVLKLMFMSCSRHVDYVDIETLLRVSLLLFFYWCRIDWISNKGSIFGNFSRLRKYLLTNQALLAFSRYW